MELGKVRLASFLNMNHELVRLADSMNWEEFCKKFGESFDDRRGRPGLPTRLMVGLTYLKYLYDLSDEAVVAQFLESGYWQYFCGFEYFQHELPCDSSSLTRWRKRLGEEGAEKLLTETLAVAHKLGLITLRSCERVIVDTTVQEKNITFPTDSKLINKARDNLVKAAKYEGISLRQTYTFKGKYEAHRCSRLLHARQYNRAQTSIRRQKRYLARVIRDVKRKCTKPEGKLLEALTLAMKVYLQDRKSPKKIYSLHEPHVECISKGKARQPYEFGNKVSLTVTARDPWIIGAKSFFGNPFDGATLKEAIAQTEKLTGVKTREIFVDKGYRGKKHHPEGKTVLISGRTGLRPVLQRLLKRRSSIEPIIGHSKHDHRMETNFLKGLEGDKINPILAASSFNLRKILRSFFLSLFYWCQKMKMELEILQLHHQTI
jgi:IS5 family transposase